MHRTTVLLPDHLKHAAQVRADQRGSSLAALIRESLQYRLKSETEPRSRDPLFLDTAISAADIPADLSERHDAYAVARS